MEPIFDLTNCSESEKSNIIEDYSSEYEQASIKKYVKCNCSDEDFSLKIKDYPNKIDPILNSFSKNEKVLLRAECLKCNVSSLVFRNFSPEELSIPQRKSLEEKLSKLSD